MWEVFEHTADLGLRARAEDVDGLFAEMARALFSVIVEDKDRVRPIQEKSVRISGDELDFLLFDWLGELLYIFESERLLLSEFDVRVSDRGLEAACRGEPMNRTRHCMGHEVKAVTYHGLKVERAVDGWLAEVILDI